MQDRQETWDVVVIGYGGAGAVAALEAADAGARVLLVEKMEHPGGLTMLCSGYLRVATEAAGAAAYLGATSGGRIERTLIEALAQGMTDVPRYLTALGEHVGAVMHLSVGANQAPYETSDLYDWPGREAFGWAGIAEIPGFAGYPHVHFASRGQLLMRALVARVDASAIEVWLNTPAERLVVENGAVVGVVVERAGQTVAVRARGGVILACGGFEFNRQMLQDFMEMPVVHPIGHPGNTGDGIRMAQQVGAALWHMWHVHGSYGFCFPDAPVAFRMHLGGSRRSARKVAWILVDQQGERFTNEVPPAPQDTGWRPLTHLDPERGRFDRIPCWMIFDDESRRLGPIARPISSVPAHYYDWSPDNLKEVERGWILAAPTIVALAEKMAVPVDSFVRAIDRWNAGVVAGRDADFERPAGTLAPVGTPPFYAIQTWPVISNTQGGPRHDEYQRVLDAFGAPISGLYAVGELGSFFGHVYLLGGNLTEGVVGGRIAGRRAAEGRDRAPLTDGFEERR